MFTAAIEILDARFKELVHGNVHLDKLYTGCRWAEGPAYFPAGRYLIWSDIPNDRILRYDECDGSVAVFRHPANNTNGHTVDREGRLISCEHRGRCVSRIEHNGKRTVLADRWQGKRLNSPNDVVVKSDGSIWFSDPTYGIDSHYEGDAADSEIGSSHVFRIDPANGAVAAVATDFVKPNGLAFSPDESFLYVADRHDPCRGWAAPHPALRAFLGRAQALRRRKIRDLRCRAFRRLSLRREGAFVDLRGRWRALLPSQWRSPRQDQGAGGGGECAIRRAEAQPPLHLRHDLALRHLRARAWSVASEISLRSLVPTR
jgi:sugar lactone lactonase YvrE